MALANGLSAARQPPQSPRMNARVQPRNLDVARAGRDPRDHFDRELLIADTPCSARVLAVAPQPLAGRWYQASTKEGSKP
jgi:hypothetical protein